MVKEKKTEVAVKAAAGALSAVSFEDDADQRIEVI
jgi:hypothetical protein